MDKGWMKEPKFSENYLAGVESFMQFVWDNMGSQCIIRCPCRTCCNVFRFSQDEVEDHLLLKGISESYTNWIYHGEQSEFNISNVRDQDYGHTSHHDDGSINHVHEGNDGLRDMLEDRFPGRDEVQIENSSSTSLDFRKSEGEVFKELLKEAQAEISPCCSNSSRLTFAVKLLHLKVYNRWSNSSIDMLLGFLRNTFPKSSIPDRIEFFKDTHYSKAKGWSTPAAEKAYNEMIQMLNETPEEGKEPMTVDEIMEKVLGKSSGYVKGLGYGPKPVKSSNAKVVEVNKSSKETEMKLKKCRLKIKGMKAKMKSKMDAMMNALKGAGIVISNTETSESEDSSESESSESSEEFANFGSPPEIDSSNF